MNGARRRESMFKKSVQVGEERKGGKRWCMRYLRKKGRERGEEARRVKERKEGRRNKRGCE